MTAFAINSNNNNNEDVDTADGTIAWTFTQMYCCTVARTILNAR